MGAGGIVGASKSTKVMFRRMSDGQRCRNDRREDLRGVEGLPAIYGRFGVDCLTVSLWSDPGKLGIEKSYLINGYTRGGGGGGVGSAVRHQCTLGRF